MKSGLVILISGRGSNLQAILTSPVGRRVKAVLSDNADAAGLAIAARHDKPTYVCSYAGGRAEAEAQLTQYICAEQPALVALAGFMRVLSEDFIHLHGERVVNIHPSLLPEFPGLDTHRRALAAGVRRHGCTVHWVSAEVDGGDIIASAALTVNQGEDEEQLAARVLELEHQLYPQVLEDLLSKAEAVG